MKIDLTDALKDKIEIEVRRQTRVDVGFKLQCEVRDPLYYDFYDRVDEAIMHQINQQTRRVLALTTVGEVEHQIETYLLTHEKQFS